MSEPALITRMTDRRNAMSPQADLRLYEDRIELIQNNKIERRLALKDVTKVRMAVEMAGQDTQVVCRVYAHGKAINFGSRAFKGPGSWTNNALEFRTFVLELHKILQNTDSDITYVEGQTLAFRVIVSTLGGVILGLGLFFGYYLWVEENNTMLALITLPFMAIGGYLMWLFRPGIPLPYDPKGLIKRFERSSEKSQAEPSSQSPGK